MAVERVANIGEMSLAIDVVANVINSIIITQTRAGAAVPAFVLYRADGTELSRVKPLSGQSRTVTVNISAPMTSFTHPSFGLVSMRDLPLYGFFEHE